MPIATNLKTGPFRRGRFFLFVRPIDFYDQVRCAEDIRAAEQQVRSLVGDEQEIGLNCVAGGEKDLAQALLPYVRMYYLGNAAQLATLFALANLYLVRRQLMYRRVFELAYSFLLIRHSLFLIS